VTHLAAAVAGLTWLVLEWIVLKKPSVVGASTGVVAGLVAITPASGFVDPAGAFVIGIVVSILSFTFMSVFRKKFKYDDALDVFSVHGLGGIWGAIAVGIFATPLVNAAGKGLVAGNPAQLGIQLLSVGMAAGLAIVGTLIALGITKLLCGGKLRPSEDAEAEGLDLSEHGEKIEAE
jgi:Amt family ammonium transporter